MDYLTSFTGGGGGSGDIKKSYENDKSISHWSFSEFFILTPTPGP